MKHKISRWQGAGLVATTLLGTGVFILPQLTISNAGADSVLVWLLLTLMIIPIALVMGKLAATYPHAAGPAHFVEQAFGMQWGRSLGLLFLFVVPFGAPAAMIITFTFFSSLTGISGGSLLLSELAALALLFLLNRRGLKLSALVQLFIAVAVVTLITVLLFVPSSQAVSPWVPPDVNLQPILTGIGIAFWSFLGLEAITHLANDFRKPARDIVPAMVIGCLLVGGIYIATTGLILHNPTRADVAIMGVAELKLGNWGTLAIGILGVAGGLATVNVYVASISRLLASFAGQGILPTILARRNAQDVPTTAILFILLINAAMLLLTFVLNLDLEALITSANGVFVLIYIATLASAWRLLNAKYRPLIVTGLLLLWGIMWGIGLKMVYALLCLVAIWAVLTLRERQRLATAEQL